MFRVGYAFVLAIAFVIHSWTISHRELPPPAANAAEVAAEVEVRSTKATEPSQSPRTKRNSRMSMTTLFNPNGFMAPRPSTLSAAPKKLRKARSIPDMNSVGDVDEVASPPTHTGRAHSQSVTAMDMPRFAQPSLVSLTSRNGDIFGDVMDWFTPASSSVTSFSSHGFLSGTPSLVHTENSDSRPIIAHPFGVGVSFESPTKRAPHPPEHLAPAPRPVRLMQSFESGLTARQDDIEEQRPASAIRLMSNRVPFVEEAPSRPSSTYEPPAEAAMVVQYSTTIFDVLQTYRGLPSLDKALDSISTVRISLSTDLSAVPRDDPRFVIWGEANTDHDVDVHSTSRDSITSNPISRRSSKASRSGRNSETSSIAGPAPRILLAATIERWIAQLTSDLNYDELLDFFLTYRTFISGVDLCHILIARFHWALQQPKNSQDESVRQVVRVRTFVAIRYWLLTFFTVDFLPNRELRLVISNWLNTLIHDEILKQHSDGLVSGSAPSILTFYRCLLPGNCTAASQGCKGVQANAHSTNGSERSRTDKEQLGLEAQDTRAGPEVC